MKKASCHGNDPVEMAFEQLSSRFDLFLTRRFRKHNDKQRGIIVFDKASTEARIQSLARDFKHSGTNGAKVGITPKFPFFLTPRRLGLSSLPIWWRTRCSGSMSTTTTHCTA
jgi:hypothetical protein